MEKESVGGPEGAVAPVRWSERWSAVERWARVGEARSHLEGEQWSEGLELGTGRREARASNHSQGNQGLGNSSSPQVTKGNFSQDAILITDASEQAEFKQSRKGEGTGQPQGPMIWREVTSSQHLPGVRLLGRCGLHVWFLTVSSLLSDVVPVLETPTRTPQVVLHPVTANPM